MLYGLLINTEVTMALIRGNGHKDQTAFADAIGMEFKDLNDYIINRRPPTRSFIEMLCHHLDCQPATFLSYGRQPDFMSRKGTKLTDEDCSEIKKLYIEEDYSVEELAEKYGVPDSQIRAIGVLWLAR